jgi:Rod binding domain-containing protein
MIEAVTSGLAGAAADPRVKQLREATAAMESVFMGELLKAMRETVPSGGALEGGAGEAIFSSMLDDHVASLAAAKQSRGLGAALFRQLSPLLGTEPTTPEQVG